MQKDAVLVKNFYTCQSEKLDLKLVAGATGLDRLIREPTVNRPGLALAGFSRYFARNRVQVFGSAESAYLKSLPEETRKERYVFVCAQRIPCIVYCRGINPDRHMLHSAEEHKVPIFKSSLITMKFINLATVALEHLFAPHSLEMGSMVDIHGIGIIIKGESGIGKSECVLELIERGYSLVSDDMTKVTLSDGKEIIGTSPPVTRNHMEVRGIGIINVGAMFGVKSMRTEKRVDLVVTLKMWNDVQDIDRLGMEQEYCEILGIKVPHITIPVRPGRNLARLVEVAAYQMKLRILGYNSAKELDQRLIENMAAKNRSDA